MRDDIRAVIEVTHARGQKVKVIFENAYLNDEQKIRLCEICGELHADWVKTSTGYAPGGATTEDLILMRQHTPVHVQVKAAGGVRTLDRLLEVRARRRRTGELLKTQARFCDVPENSGFASEVNGVAI